jgi:hypothetical protein
MKQLILIWQFFDNGVGGFLFCGNCPFGRTECASYGIVRAGEKLVSGVGWQCEFLKPFKQLAYCDVPETTQFSQKINRNVCNKQRRIEK